MVLWVLGLCLVAGYDPGMKYMHEWNVFMEKDFTSFQVDDQGRLAAGRDVSLKQFEVGTLEPKDCTRIDLLVGGTLRYNQGQVLHGKIHFGSETEFTGVSEGCPPPVHAPSPVPFAVAFEELRSTSKRYSAEATTGKIAVANHRLTCKGSDRVNWFTVPPVDFGGEVTEVLVDIPADSFAVLNIAGKSNHLIDLNMNYTAMGAKTNPRNVLLNYYETTELTLRGLSIYGSILAPRATVQFDNGNIEGSLCGSSYNGTGEIHFPPYNPVPPLPPPPTPPPSPPPSPPPTPPPCPPCLNITLPDFSLFVHHVIKMSTVDDMGRMGAGGPVSLTLYAAGTNLTCPPKQPDTVVVAGDLTWDEGSCKAGNIRYGGVGNISGGVGLPCGKAYRAPSPINFDRSFIHLDALAHNISELVSNGTIVHTSPHTMTLQGTHKINIFHLPLGWDATTTALEVHTPLDAWAIINVGGMKVNFTSMGLSQTGTTPFRMLWNVYEATSVTMTRTAMQGSVLAPKADVFFDDGNIDGSLICENLKGRGETHHWMFEEIEICPPCPPPP